MSSEAGRTTHMVHYACRKCEMTATCVSNVSSTIAWFEHMKLHDDPNQFDEWTWGVVQLGLCD